jgi:hypothetical protein
MGWRSEIEVTTTIDLCDYDDEIMDYVEPDNINDALEMMERWGYSDGDILAHMLDDMDNELFLSKVAGVLTVESALQLVKGVYEYGQSIQIRNMLAKDNQIKELREKIQQLEESNDESSTTNQADGVE